MDTQKDTQKTDDPQELPFRISDAAWKSILPFLIDSPNVYVGNPEDCRRFLSAVIWITKEGATWRALPKVYGHWNTIYRRFGRWCDAGVFQALHEHFHDAGEVSAILVDSTTVRAHSCAAGAPKKKGGQEAQCLGRSRGGFTTKLNLALSDECVPLRWTLTAGQCHDITQASALIQGYSCQSVIGDKAYDSDAFIAEITSRDAVAVIPPRKNRKEPRTYDQELYKRRNLIERFFNWLKQYRRVATRYDKLAVRFLGFVYLASILIKSKRNVNTT
jgi:transposase